MGRFWSELRRRRVLPTALAYGVVALALAEGADVFLPSLGYPDLVRPVLVALLLAFPVVLIGSWAFQITPGGVVTDQLARELGGAAPRHGGHSVAVLPFTDMSPDGEQGYFADGMAEELINALTRVPQLKVAARTSTFALKGRDLDVRDIGRELGVSTVLEGSVRKAGDQVRITAQLVDVEDGMHLFSESYDRQLADVFKVQDEISKEVVGVLQSTLLDDVDRIVEPATVNLEAYDLYLKGRYHWHRRYKVGLQTALKYFESASELDPDYALPYTGIADTFTTLGTYAFLRGDHAAAKAKPAAARALALDPSLPEAHFSDGFAKLFFDADFDGCRASMREALRLKRGFGEAQAWTAVSTISQGRFTQGLEELAPAIEMDPYSVYLMEVTATGHAFGKRFEDALEMCDRVLALEPDSAIGLYVSASSLASLARFDEAVGRMKRVVDVVGRHPAFVAWLARTYSLAGQREESEACREEVLATRGQDPLIPGPFIVLHAGLGEVDEAWRWLQRANECGGFPSIALPGLGFWEPVRSDPRFRGVWSDMGVDISAWL